MKDWAIWVVLGTPAVISTLGGFIKFLMDSHAKGLLRRNLILVGYIMTIALAFRAALPHLPADSPLPPLLFVWACIAPVLVLLWTSYVRVRAGDNENFTRRAYQAFVVALVAVGGFSIWALLFG